MNKDIKWIIIETLDITPSEFTERFENAGEYKELKEDDYKLLQIAEKCYNLNRGQVVSGTINTPWVGKTTGISTGNPITTTEFRNTGDTATIYGNITNTL